MRMLIGSRKGHLKFHKTYACLSAEGSGVVTQIQACTVLELIDREGSTAATTWDANEITHRRRVVWSTPLGRPL